MDNRQVARLLEEIATLLELKGENPFKTRAYQNAARAVDALEESVADLVAAGRLIESAGIGSGIAEKITELVQSGRLTYAEGLRREVPAGLLEMVRIPGLGPKRARAIYDALAVASLEDLERACREDQLKDLKGFGAKTQTNILAGIALRMRARERRLLSEAEREAEAVVAAVRECPGIQRLSVAGSLRRRRETIKDIDIVVSSSDPAPVMAAFTAFNGVETVVARGGTKSSVRLASGMQVDLRVVSEAEFPFALLYFTGSKAHNIGLRGRALRMGLKLNEYGLFAGDTLIPCHTEEDVYKRLGLALIPPELREDTGELAAAERGELPRLVDREDLRGLLHVKSTWSGGSDSIADLAGAARARGYRYVGFADRADEKRELLTEPGFRARQAEIRAAAAAGGGCQLLHGLEVDILAGGELDCPESILAELDFVIAAVHSDYDQSAPAMTARLKRAVANRFTTILGHPTSRLIFARDPSAMDLAEVLAACAEQGVAVEVNGDPRRLDLDWMGCRRAREAGCLVAIDAGAHAALELEQVAFGLGTARRGWIEAEQVMNTNDWDTIREAKTNRTVGGRSR
jgi:DNA polymerase (family 10)